MWAAPTRFQASAMRGGPPQTDPTSRCRFTLRFDCANTERFFVAMQADVLARNLFYLATIASLAACGFLIYSWQCEALYSSSVQVWRLNCCAAIACGALAATVAVCAQVPSIRREVKPATREVLVVTVMLLLATLQFLIDPWYAGKVLGIDPASSLAEVYGGVQSFSDTRPVLVLSILVVASHLALPIRWVCLGPLEVGPGVLYLIFAYGVEGPDKSHSWSTFLLFEALT
eukprot:CAMPEP_0175334988 /NCGR_PEP_ID=MMETSP0095-20121207/3069_1 /TAXON_ID=311494 /ORGANISM="Alexandrium monilatum, Strain CCMP3105" /LENGTH=229 /DNA_ID=CAMNT_0016632309 /DNA_START=1 /DNA_END=687 /DNA_ORIENTATION=+